MMRQRYLSFFIYHLSFGIALLLAACSGEEKLTNEGTAPAEGKTPLRLEATLSTGSGVTRAVGNKFEANDQLVTYIRHTTSGTAVGSYSYIENTNPEAPTYTTDEIARANKLITFTVGSEATGTTSALTTPIYWDDFSESTIGAADGYGPKDLRAAGHGLQSYYGYCYNGGSSNISTPLVENTGVLGWTVPAYYANATAFKNADLLWSQETEAVTYDHASSKDADHNTALTIPYTHAMSEVTVVVTVDDSFTKTNPLADGAAILTLYGMNTKVALTAPTGGYVASTDADDTKNITMIGASGYTTGKTRTFTALMVPGSKMKADTKLLNIRIDGVDYEVNVTAAMLSDDEGKWGSKLDAADASGYRATQPGVNYKLTIDVGKARVNVAATIADWTTVEAEGQGTPYYENDINVTGTGATFANASTFSLFRLKHGGSTDESSERTNIKFDEAVTSTYSSSNSTWTNSPLIYWTGASDYYYFRAIAKFTSKDANNVYTITNTGVNTKATATPVSQGTDDILWGTTPAYTLNTTPVQNIPIGGAVRPRSGEVPIHFEHALSKVTFILKTTNDVTVTDANAKVDISNATIKISNLYTSATIKLEDGSMEYKDNAGNAISKTADAISGTTAETPAGPETANTSIANYIVIPQTIANTSVITITLNNGSKYTLQLNTCQTGAGTEADPYVAIKAWERGKDYTYTITVTKDEVQFRALVKDWDEVAGSGNATLEWD